MAQVFINDTSALSREKWREERKKGIGGSDVGAILGVNKYQSVFDIYYDKIGVQIKQPVSAKTKATLEIGTRLEDLVADMFQEKYPSIQVVNDKAMYQHDRYSFMLANMDRRLILPDKRNAVLECKTLTYGEDWESTDVCRGISGKCPLSYEFQVRHYMAVMNYDMAFVVGLDLLRKELYVVLIIRDKEIEKQMIAAEKEFWKLVERRTFPHLGRHLKRLCTAVKADAFKRFYGANKDVVYQVHQKEEIDLFNQMNDLIMIQQFHYKEAKLAKEAKEDLAVKLFTMCGEKLDKKPSKIELNSITEDLSVNQYVTITDTTAVSFDLKKFVETYNFMYQADLPEDIDKETALALCSLKMPALIGEFITMGEKSAQFYFSKRKSKLRKETGKRKKHVE